MSDWVWCFVGLYNEFLLIWIWNYLTDYGYNMGQPLLVLSFSLVKKRQRKIKHNKTPIHTVSRVHVDPFLGLQKYKILIIVKQCEDNPNGTRPQKLCCFYWWDSSANYIRKVLYRRINIMWCEAVNNDSWAHDFFFLSE